MTPNIQKVQSAYTSEIKIIVYATEKLYETYSIQQLENAGYNNILFTTESEIVKMYISSKDKPFILITFQTKDEISLYDYIIRHKLTNVSILSFIDSMNVNPNNYFLYIRLISNLIVSKSIDSTLMIGVIHLFHSIYNTSLKKEIKKDSLIIKAGINTEYNINLNEMTHIMIEKNYAKVYNKNKEMFSIKISLVSLLDQAEKQFIRVSRNTVLNYKKIQHFDETTKKVHTSFGQFAVSDKYVHNLLSINAKSTVSEVI